MRNTRNKRQFISFLTAALVVTGPYCCCVASRPLRPGGDDETARKKDSVSFVTDCSSLLHTAGSNTNARTVLQKNRHVASSLSERFSSLAEDSTTLKSTDFYHLLLTQEAQEKELESRKSNIQQHQSDFGFLWKSLLSGSVLLAVSSWISAGSAAVLVKELSKLVTSTWSVLWIPFLWIRPQQVKQDAISYLHIFFGNWQVIRHFQTSVLPLTLGVLQKMVLAELWGRFWSTIFKQVDQLCFVQQDENKMLSSSTMDKGHQSSLVSVWLSSWDFMETTLQKGIKNMIKSAMQKQITSSIFTVSAFVWNALREEEQETRSP